MAGIAGIAGIMGMACAAMTPAPKADGGSCPGAPNSQRGKVVRNGTAPQHGGARRSTAAGQGAYQLLLLLGPAIRMEPRHFPLLSPMVQSARGTHESRPREDEAATNAKKSQDRWGRDGGGEQNGCRRRIAHGFVRERRRREEGACFTLCDICVQRDDGCPFEAHRNRD